MKRIGFDTRSSSLVIMGGGVYPARSLMVSEETEGRFQIWSLAGRAEQVIGWDELMDLDGDTFGSIEEARAYLDSEFAKGLPAGGDAYTIGVEIAEAGQQVIPLQAPPTVLSSARLVINGIEYYPPDIAVSAVAVTWLNAGFELSPSDRVMVIYT